MKVKEEYCWAVALAVGCKAHSIEYRVFIMLVKLF